MGECVGEEESQCVIACVYAFVCVCACACACACVRVCVCAILVVYGASAH